MTLYVFDLDGTLADIGHRVHLIQGVDKDWRGFFEACPDDAPIKHTIQLLKDMWAAGAQVEIWTGRSDEVRAETWEWLLKVGCPLAPTRMREAGDHRSDVEVKREMLMKATDEGCRPDLVFEDRARVVAMWRAEGVPCFQVSEGEF